MGTRADEFNDSTARVEPPGRLATSLMRRPPQLAWRDARGEQRATLSECVVVGSAASVDVRIDDPTVSRLHAELEPRVDGWWVRDLGSTNGTLVDGVRVGSALLRDGALLRLGGVDLAVHYGASTESVALWPIDRFGPLVGRSAAMRELFARLARVAASDATALIHGETGTGKELIARAIHEHSARRGQPYVIVDCAALPEHLFEAELFGHARGAFTGALEPRAGALESADGGTVFLDEIGELPPAMQPKLLRAIESRMVRRVGETVHRAIDVRYVSATHRDLRTMVNQGAFREDLYFRLAVLPVEVPPLRARPDDVPVLIDSFLAARGGGRLDPSLVAELAQRPWLGNARELRNFVDRALALGPGEALALARGEKAPTSLAPPPGVAATHEGLPLREVRERALREAERAYVQALLADHGRDVDAMAAAAGVDRSYVHKLLKRYAL